MPWIKVHRATWREHFTSAMDVCSGIMLMYVPCSWGQVLLRAKIAHAQIICCVVKSQICASKNDLYEVAEDERLGKKIQYQVTKWIHTKQFTNLVFHQPHQVPSPCFHHQWAGGEHQGSCNEINIMKKQYLIPDVLTTSGSDAFGISAAATSNSALSFSSIALCI